MNLARGGGRGRSGSSGTAEVKQITRRRRGGEGEDPTAVIGRVHLSCLLRIFPALP